MSWVNPVWSDEERQLLRQLWRQRNDPNELKHHFPGRTAKAVKNMASKMGLITWRIRRDETAAHRAVENRVVVPECLWADRDRRANAPRTLTQLLMGDPPVSQSALARAMLHPRGQPKAEKAYEAGPTYLDPAAAV